MNRIRVEIAAGSQGTRVWLNDQEIVELVAVTVRAAVDELATIILEFHGSAAIAGLVDKVEEWPRP